MDFATLTLGAETAGLEKGERSLDSVTAAAGRTEKAADGVADGFNRAGAAASKSTREQKSYQEALGRTQAVLGTNVRSFEELRRAIDPSYAASQKYAEVQRLVAASISAGEASQQAANLVLQEAARRYMGVVPAAERAAVAQKKAAQDAQGLRAAYEATRASVDPLFASSKRYEAALETLNEAQRAGAISDKERAQTLKLMEAQLAGAGQEMVRVTGRFDALFASVGGGQFALKQTAFQLNQVAQQGAVTGDYMGALSIQAADMLTIFGTWGILAGGLIAVTGPLIMSLFDTGKGAEKAAKGVDKLEGASRAYIEIAETARAKTGDLRKEYGKHAEAVREVHRELVKVAEQMALNQMDAAISEASGSLDDLMASVGQLSQARKELGAALAAQDEGGFLPKAELDALELQVTRILEEIQNQFGLTSAEAYRVKDAIDAVNNAATKEEAAEAARRLSLAISSAYEGSRRIPDEMGKIASEAGRVFAVFARIVSTTEQAGAAAVEVADEIGEAAVKALELANVDIESGVSAAAKEAAVLAANLGVSLNAAVNLSNLQASKEYSGRGGDPRKFAEASYQQALGYKSVDEVVKELTKSSKQLGSATQNSLAGLQLDIEQRKKLLGLTGDQRAKYQALITVQQRLGKNAGKYSKAQIEGLAGQLVELEKLEKQQERINELQSRWSEEITRTAFEGGSLGETIEGMLRDIAYQFAHAKIVLPVVASVTGFLGLNQLLLGGSGAAQVAGAAAGGGGGGGLLNLLSGGANLLGGGGALSGIASGLGGIFSGGGLGSSFANLGGLVTGASAGWGALGAALPALGIIAGVGAVLKKAFSRKYSHSGLVGHFGNHGFDGQTFDHYKGGWFRSDKTIYSRITGEMDASLDEAFGLVTQQVKDMAESLGLDGERVHDFKGRQFTLGTNGVSQERLQEQIEAEMRAAASSMAALTFETKEFIRAGENSLEALERLSSSLLSANDALDLLSHQLFDVSVIGGDAASNLLDAFGGADAMTAAVNAYFAAFYTSEEQAEALRRRALERLGEQFDDLGLSLPRSRAEFRALVESVDLTSEAGRELYAQLVSLSGAMDQVLPKVSAYTEVMQGIVDEIGGEIGVQISAAQDMARISEHSAQLWYRTATTLRDFLSDLLNTDLTAVSRSQAMAMNRSRFETAFDMARAGDVEAARDIPELAKAYLNSAQANAATSLEYRRIAATVQGQVNFLAGIAELEGANDDVLSALYEQQIEVLTSLGKFLQLEGLTNDQVGQLSDGVQALAEDWDGTVEAFQTSLGALEDAISNAEAFSYDDLVGSLDVAVSLAEDAPRWVQRLVNRADTGLRTALDFVIRNDELSPADKWIATNAVSQHVAEMSIDLKGGSRNALNKISQISDLIDGTGKLTLAGGVELTLDEAFGTGTTQLTTSMGALGGYLNELRAAVDADRQQREDAQTLARLQVEGATAAANYHEMSGQGIVDQIRSLERATGVWLNAGHTLEVGDDGQIQYKADHVVRSAGSNLEAWSKGFWADGGLEDQIFTFNWQHNKAESQVEKLRQKIRDLGGIPAFARGTSFAPGGRALVGEMGPEIVDLPRGSTVHPYSQSKAMLDNSDVVAELRALRREVTELRQEQRRADFEKIRAAKEGVRLAQRSDVVGVKIREDV